MLPDGRGYRWSRIDEVELPHYPYPSRDDQCYYLLGKTKGTWKESTANSIVSNFQRNIKKHRDNPVVMDYKRDAIIYFAKQLYRTLAKRSREHPMVVVPMITYKRKQHRFHDGRLQQTVQFAQQFRPGKVAADDILDVHYELQNNIITTGGHYAAYRDTIRPLYPHAKIAGVFLSR